MKIKLEIFWKVPTLNKPRKIDAPDGFMEADNKQILLKPLEEQYNDRIVSYRIIFEKE